MDSQNTLNIGRPEVPSGTTHGSPARKRLRMVHQESPGGATQDIIQPVSRIAFKAMPPENGAKFLLEGEFAMMLLLISNIANDRIEVRCANAKGAVSLLPCEVTPASFNHFDELDFSRSTALANASFGGR